MSKYGQHNDLIFLWQNKSFYLYMMNAFHTIAYETLNRKKTQYVVMLKQMCFIIICLFKVHVLWHVPSVSRCRLCEYVVSLVELYI